MPSSHHSTWTQPYRDRALLPDTAPLTAYLLALISIKRTNLCLSADVSTTSELLALADEVGDSICLLKTHCDIINDFSDRTVKGLRDIAKRKKFLVFEDRKFADIGGTVQKQYTSGRHSIAKWAEITNAHILPGPAIVTALKQAAAAAISAYNTAVHTEISATPPSDPASVSPSPPEFPGLHHTTSNDQLEVDISQGRDDRKASVVSISTTISTKTENITPQPTPDIDLSDQNPDTKLHMMEKLGPSPFLRALLLLAEMSSADNLLTGDYTKRCAEIAREHKDFVMGFIAQHSLNSEPGDNFVTMTPGVKLPPAGSENTNDPMGDGLGQQYNTPWKIVYEQGCDVIIVGRGIIAADDRLAEAERYRIEGWKAYEARIGAK